MFVFRAVAAGRLGRGRSRQGIFSVGVSRWTL